MTELTRYQESTRPSIVDALRHRVQAALSFLTITESIPTETEPEISIQRPVVVDARTAAINALKVHYSDDEAVRIYEQSVAQSALIDAQKLPGEVFVPDTNAPHDEESYANNHAAYMAHMNRVLGADNKAV